MNHRTLFVSKVNVGCPPKCIKRKPGCQDHCETYLTNKKINEDYKTKVRDEKEKRRILDYIPPRDRRR